MKHRDISAKILEYADPATDVSALESADPATDVSALESEIDRLVHALYHLAPEEIAIVEGRGS